MSRKNQIAVRLGLKVRELRRQKSITLIELSKLTGIAQATLSRMETGLMLGTVASHQKIAETLGVSVADLYKEIDSRYEKIKLHHADEPKKVTAKTDQIKCELLTQEISKKKITPLLITLQGQGKSESEKLEHGVEKFLFVLEGAIKVVIGDKTYTLNTEETIYFDGSLPHQLMNATGKQIGRASCRERV